MILIFLLDSKGSEVITEIEHHYEEVVIKCAQELQSPQGVEIEPNVWRVWNKIVHDTEEFEPLWGEWILSMLIWQFHIKNCSVQIETFCRCVEYKNNAAYCETGPNSRHWTWVKNVWCSSSK